MWFSSEARVRQSLAAQGLGVFELDASTGEVVCDRLVREHLGIDRAIDADLNLLLDHIHFDERRAVHHAFMRALFEGGDLRLRFRLLRSGDTCYLRARTFAQARGRPDRLVGVTQLSTHVAARAA